MRKSLITILLAATVAMPAVAQDERRQHDRGGQNIGGQDDGDERAARRADRAERIERRAGDDDQRAARQQVFRQQFEQQAQRPDEAQGRRGWDQRRWGEDPSSSSTAERRQRRADAGIREPVVAPEGMERGPAFPRVFPERVREGMSVGVVGDGNRGREGTRDGRGGAGREAGVRERFGRSGSGRAWSHDWRRDRDHDWRAYRDRNRSLFRLGRYRDPFGSHYRRFSIGFSLFPSYYQSNYWLDDPAMYRLPQVYGPYRWVRYYDDALLVNIYTGQVVDVVYSFFW